MAVSKELLKANIAELFRKNVSPLLPDHGDIWEGWLESVLEMFDQFELKKELLPAVEKILKDIYTELGGQLYARDISPRVRKLCQVALKEVFEDIVDLYNVDERKGENRGEVGNIVDLEAWKNQKIKL